MFFRIVFFVSLFSFLSVSSQQVKQRTVYKVYDDIIQAIGNTNPRPPNLVIKEKGGPASYRPKSNEIRIDDKLLSICHTFGKDSLNALSYILAHELGHHYKDHGYATKYASLDFVDPDIGAYRDALEYKELDSVNKVLKIQQKIKNETQADVYAGFYSHLAGYDALSIASDFLDKVYQEYNLKQEIKGYPSLSERKRIIDKNKSDFEGLKYVFDIANITMSMGQYDYAQNMFEYILKQGFTSREIYNNLGLCYVYQALNLELEGKYFNLILPFKTDLSSRLCKSSLTRGFKDEENAILLLNSAVKEFSTALDLDPNYTLAKENLYYTEMSLSYLGETLKKNIDFEDFVLLDDICIYCAKGHNATYNKQLRKAKSYFKKGSDNCPICEINIDFKKKQTEPQKENKITEFHLYDLAFNDISMNCLDITSKKEYLFYNKLDRLRIAIEMIGDVKLIRLKEKINRQNSCIAIQEYSSNKNYKNNIDIYVGDPVEAILDNHINLRIINAGNYKYLSLVNENITFLIVDDKVKKWYYFERLN